MILFDLCGVCGVLMLCRLISILIYFGVASSTQFHDISYEEMNSHLLALEGDFAVVAPATKMLAVNVQ